MEDKTVTDKPIATGEISFKLSYLNGSPYNQPIYKPAGSRDWVRCPTSTDDHADFPGLNYWRKLAKDNWKVTPKTDERSITNY